MKVGGGEGEEWGEGGQREARRSLWGAEPLRGRARGGRLPRSCPGHFWKASDVTGGQARRTAQQTLLVQLLFFSSPSPQEGVRVSSVTIFCGRFLLSSGESLQNAECDATKQHHQTHRYQRWPRHSHPRDLVDPRTPLLPEVVVAPIILNQFRPPSDNSEKKSR